MLDISKNYNNIIFTNDFHSNFPYKTNLIEKIIDYKNKNSLIIDNGDFSEGSAFYEFSQGKIEKYCLENFYNVIIPGNHGFNDLLELKNKNLIINCNIYSDNKPFFTTHKIFFINSYKVAVIGVISTEAFLSIPYGIRSNFNCVEPIKQVKKIIKTIRKNVDFILVCSHSGLNFDKENFNISGVDIVISSHCHSKTNFYMNNNIQFVKACDSGRSIGLISFNNKNIKFLNKKIYTKETLFKKQELLILNKDIKEYLVNYKKKIININKNVQMLMKNRKKFLIYLIKHGTIGYYCINYTFFREVFKNKEKYFSKEMLINFVPFDTVLLVLKDTSCNFNNFIKDIPNEIIEKSLIEATERKGNINFVTTDYLYNNFYKKNNTAVILKKINVRKMILKIMLQNNKTIGKYYE